MKQARFATSLLLLCVLSSCDAATAPPARGAGDATSSSDDGAQGSHGLVPGLNLTVTVGPPEDPVDPATGCYGCGPLGPFSIAIVESSGALVGWLDTAGSTRGPLRAPISTGPAGEAILKPEGALGSGDGGAHWEQTIGSLTLSPVGGGEAPAAWTGLVVGTRVEVWYDVYSDSLIANTIAAELDVTPPTVTLVPDDGPPLSVRLEASELVREADVRDAVTVTVDGAPSSFTVEPALTGPPGTARTFAIRPDPPAEFAAPVVVTAGPIPDLAGTPSTDAPSLTSALPGLPDKLLATTTDFSDAQGLIDVAPPAAVVAEQPPVTAPTGGAMLSISVLCGAPGQSITLGVRIPDGATHLRLDAATLRSDASTYSSPFQAALLLPGGVHVAVPTTPAPPPITPDGTSGELHPFSAYTIDVTGLGGSEGLLRLGTAPDAPVGGPSEPRTDSPAWHLVDRIVFE